MSTETLRAAFEAWAAKETPPYRLERVLVPVSDLYAWNSTACAWEAFQAGAIAAAKQAEPVAQARALVAAVDEQHSTKGAPLKYTVPWGALASMKEALEAAPPAPAAEREPLTLQQLNNAARQAQIDYCLDKFSNFQVALARAIEKAHGIGITPKGST